MPVSSSPQAEETRSEEALDEDIDGAPLSGEEKDDEDLDGVPLDGAALLKSALMRAIPDVDAATPKRETPKRDEYLDEIDGIPCKPVQVIETSFLITENLNLPPTSAWPASAAAAAIASASVAPASAAQQCIRPHGSWSRRGRRCGRGRGLSHAGRRYEGRAAAHDGWNDAANAAAWPATGSNLLPSEERLTVEAPSAATTSSAAESPSPPSLVDRASQERRCFSLKKQKENRKRNTEQVRLDCKSRGEGGCVDSGEL